MKKKQFLACMMAMVAASAVAFVPKGEVEAAGLTQAASAEQVRYGSLTKSDVEVLKTMFDFEYYKTQNPDLVDALGDDYDKIFEHFCKCGIFEGRTCNENFDPAAYASAYSDLKDVYGNNIMMYYKHYAAVGAKENRTLTTVKACADAGITVQSLAVDNVSISPLAYLVAEKLGITEYNLVQRTINNMTKIAIEEPSDDRAVIAASSNSTLILVPEKADPQAFAKANNLTEVGTLKCSDVRGQEYSGYYFLYVVKGDVGYAIKHDDTVIASTDGYTPSYAYVSIDSISINLSAYVDESYWGTSSNDYDHTNLPVNKYVYEQTTEENGNRISIHNNARVNDELIEEAITATDYTKTVHTIDGYYTNYDGTQIHEFASEGEKAAWIVEQDLSSGGNIEYSMYSGLDVDSTRETEYIIGADIKLNEDGSLQYSVSAKNEANDFGIIATYTVEHPEELRDTLSSSSATISSGDPE